MRVPIANEICAEGGAMLRRFNGRIVVLHLRHQRLLLLAFRKELQLDAHGRDDIAQLAQAMFNKVERSLLIDRSASSWVAFRETGTGVDYAGPFTSDELAIDLSGESGPTIDGLVNIMGNNKLFVPKLVELAHKSKDLWTINRISKKLNEITDVNFFPWDLQPLDKWWAKNSMNYTNWPLEKYQIAVAAIGFGRFDIALTNFESVLAIDPTADKSRALAMACAIEIGNMSKAQQLDTNFAAQMVATDKTSATVAP